MPEENITQEFRLKKMDEWRNYLTEEINQNKLLSKKLKNVCRVLSYTEHLLIVISIATRCISLLVNKFCEWIEKLSNNCKN